MHPKEPVNEANQDAQPKEIVAIQIVLTVDGGVKLAGPMLADRTAAYGLLETAKDMVREMHTPKIVPPGGMMHFLRNGNKR